MVEVGVVVGSGEAVAYFSVGGCPVNYLSHPMDR